MCPLSLSLSIKASLSLVALEREARAEFNVRELLKHLVACEDRRVLGDCLWRREAPKWLERRVGRRVREERRGHAPEALARSFARCDRLERRFRDNDFVEASLDVPAREVLHLLASLHEQTAVWDLHGRARAVAEPDEEAWEARLAVDREQVEVCRQAHRAFVSLPTSSYSASPSVSVAAP